MRVLGIDPGLATTGFAVIEENASRSGLLDGISVLEAGIISTPAGEPLQHRLRTIHSDCVDLIEQYQPDALSIEELFFNKNTTTAMAVSHARGVVLLACSHLPTRSYTPLQIKKQICGYGQAKKPQVQAMVQRLLNIKFEKMAYHDDAHDAMAVALCFVLQRRAGVFSLEPERSA